MSSIYLNVEKLQICHVLPNLLKRDMCCVVQVIILADKVWMMLLPYNKNNICWNIVWSLCGENIMGQVFCDPCVKQIKNPE